MNLDQACLAEARAAGGSEADAESALRLGLPFPVYKGGASEFRQALAQRFVQFNRQLGRRWDQAVPPEDRAAIRTATAHELFPQAYGRAPLNERELAGFVAAQSRPITKAVAGFDLSFTPVKSVSALWALAEDDVKGQIEGAPSGRGPADSSISGDRSSSASSRT